MPSINFKGKALVQNFHLLVPYHELKTVKSKSLTSKVSLHDNLVVHGDNLKALKALLPYYHGKVKCIYIDPPYNTGNEKWVYNDNVSSPMIQEWLGKVVDREDLTRHDKWLCMMMPRLKLLRELLSDDGLIFVSIDSNEVAHLRLLMDEVFAPENFLADIAWEKRYTRSNNAKLFYSLKDTILVYRRSERVSYLRERRQKKRTESTKIRTRTLVEIGPALRTSIQPQRKSGQISYIQSRIQRARNGLNIQRMRGSTSLKPMPSMLQTSAFGGARMGKRSTRV